MNNVNDINSIISRVKEAQKTYAHFSQEQVDKIFFAAARAAADNRILLAKNAIEETDFGVIEDKIIKNHYAAEYVYNAYKNTKTCGVIEEDEVNGYTKIAEPIGIIAAIIPVTNPTSTTIYKCLLSLKTRNGIIISPHPKAKKCCMLAANIILKAAVEAGAPSNIIGCIENPTIDLTTDLMKKCDMILATGGQALVRSAYSSGKPAIGVGAGNTPCIIDESANIKMAASSIILSKSFDNGVICASEQSIIVHNKIYSQVKKEFSERGAYFLNDEETDKIRHLLYKSGKYNAKIVGKSASFIANLAEIEVPEETLVLVGEIQEFNTSDPFTFEKLSPILAFLRALDFDDALVKADKILQVGGHGHTSTLFIEDNEKNKENLQKFRNKMETCRILINMPASLGATGDMFNFRLPPSLTLGCGSWGGNSMCENIGVKHLLNTKVMAQRRKNMLWLRQPEKIFFNRACTTNALNELKSRHNFKRTFIITDNYLHDSGAMVAIEEQLDKMNIAHACYYNVVSDPTLSCIKEGLKELKNFKPDNIIAFGGGSVIDSAKIMRAMYEKEDLKFADMALRFMDIRKRICNFETINTLFLTCIPTTSGTGSEVSPFAVVTDDETNIKYPLADYSLTPNMAVVDVENALHQPKSLTAASGIDALVHAIESYVSIMSSDYTSSMALSAIKTIFDYLPNAYSKGADDIVAREKMANAATIAGIAFSNAFLGLCHSMSHKLGALCHLPHGICNALLICEVIRYNSKLNAKSAAFPQYEYLQGLDRYAQIARHLSLEFKTKEEGVEALIREIEKLKSTLEIKSCLKDYDVDEQYYLSNLDKMATESFDDQCTGANPRFPLIEDIKRIFIKIYYPRPSKQNT